MTITNSTIQLNDLEKTLEDINARLKSEIKDNPLNPKSYTYESIGVTVYDVNYIREDLRLAI